MGQAEAPLGCSCPILTGGCSEKLYAWPLKQERGSKREKDGTEALNNNKKKGEKDKLFGEEGGEVTSKKDRKRQR